MKNDSINKLLINSSILNLEKVTISRLASASVPYDSNTHFLSLSYHIPTHVVKGHMLHSWIIFNLVLCNVIYLRNMPDVTKGIKEYETKMLFILSRTVNQYIT